MGKESIRNSQTAYISRTKEARKFAEKKHKEVADYLGIDRSTYTNFERDRPMPQEYISRFCELTGINERWLISGKGAKEVDYVEKLEAAVKQQISTLRAVISSD